MRIIAKGGVWKNSEDEILKAAVMKYGKNQWSRIASLLVRKSAKQCKTRWYEWLDPSIKKTEWSREEEEKLLHLAKIMPNQWRTIAPIVGRTASQCLTHYEKLLDAAQTKEADYDPAEDPRRLRPGEIDPNPESKPARPDPVDMDEDEKEMLSEARARLANTKGKKAKRKAREKQLEEARRLASLQKRRELKAAGLEAPQRRRKTRGIDYNAEIPFQRQPPPGFYETEQPTVEDPFKQPMRIIENKRKRDYEDELRKQDIKKQKKKESTDLPGYIAQLNAQAEAKSQGLGRAKLVLPSPQLSDADLEELAKVEGGNDTRIPAELREGSSATKALLPNFSQTPTPARGLLKTPLRTPAPSHEQTILKEATALAAFVTSSTPLQGGSNPELPGDFSGIVPRRQEQRTPNVLAVAHSTTPRRDALSASLTPARNATGMTPSRNLIIGSSDQQQQQQQQQSDSQVSLTPLSNAGGELLSDTELQRKEILRGIKSLPAPQNEYNIVLPDLPQDDSAAIEEEPLEPDAADVLAEQQKQLEEMERLRFQLCSQVMQRNLPRALKIPSTMVDEKLISNEIKNQKNLGISDSELTTIHKLIEEQFSSLIIHEALEYPLSTFRSSLGVRHKFEEFSLDELSTARELVEQEMKQLDQQRSKLSSEQFSRICDSVNGNHLWVPSLNDVRDVRQLPMEKQIEAYSFQHNQLRETIEKDFQKCQHLEQRINEQQSSLTKQTASMITQIQSTFERLEKTQCEFQALQSLKELESAAISNRTEKLRQEVQRLEERETSLQFRFKNLQDTLETLSATK